MHVSVIPFSEDQSASWDVFCDHAVNATFLHTRRFLSYHGSRFEDASVSVVVNDKLVGVVPAARLPSDSSTVCSHPGITYGGLIGTEWLTGAKSLISLEAVARHYAEGGFARLLYKAVPHIYHRRPAQDDLYALQRIGARRYRTDLAAVIDLADRGAASSRRTRGLKKAQAGGVALGVGVQHIANFWALLEENLSSRHGVRPVHSEHELALLMERFPDNISLHVAKKANEVIAGVVVFDSTRVRHCQYIGVSEAGRELCGLDAIFDHCIAEALRRGLRFFSFGVSTEADGEVLNEGLHTFKSEFGASGVVHEFYELLLQK
jgi:GNAT acetyltransferase-like protein